MTVPETPAIKESSFPTAIVAGLGLTVGAAAFLFTRNGKAAVAEKDVSAEKDSDEADAEHITDESGSKSSE